MPTRGRESVESWRYDGLSGKRRPTRTVHVGDVAVGSQHPIRVQSMTTPATTDTAATVAQILRLVEAGCEIVRVTVPTSADADNLPNIRRELARHRVSVPLVADIHFTPAAALKAIEHVEKVRINPGNYADKKKFAQREYTESEYRSELERVERAFSPLVLRAKELGVSLRIGTNHGSLSDRIMNRYGDTPEGMVESALEFVRICENHSYHALILSMKSSNPVVVLQAYRLLASRMAELGMAYPFHLGVTEAGDGEDGRIKSAIGIGSLLDEGIGDTVRVSLTEDPVREIPVARALVEPYNRPRTASGPASEPSTVVEIRDPHSYRRRVSREVRVGPHVVGAAATVLVETAIEADPAEDRAVRDEIDRCVGPKVPEETKSDVISVRVRTQGDLGALERLRQSLELVAPRVALSARVEPDWVLGEPQTARHWLHAVHRLHLTLRPPLLDATRESLRRLLAEAQATGRSVLVEAAAADDSASAVDLATAVAGLESAGAPHSLLLCLRPSSGVSPLHAVRRLAACLARAGQAVPLVLLDDARERGVDPLLGVSAALGGLLCDGLGDAVHVVGPVALSRRITFGILQAARVRVTRTEFISCPSCGRTLFDLEETTARIKQSTAHLKGLKIAVMGCVVNGPGEMADADFGYVGWGENKIALFVGRDMVARDIPASDACERLVELIKLHGRWVEPSLTVAGES